MRHPVRRQAAAVLALCMVGMIGSVGSALAAPSAVNSPVRVVHVTWGRIGYRGVGHGRPLVLVTGYSDSIDGWAPSFIDLLARHHRVLVLDNEGIGRTTLRSGALSISRMGDDVADFIAALHLRRPDVLGWSLGGLDVQALAVRHPGSVRRLILYATLPGDGSATASSIPVRSSQPFANFFPPDDFARRIDRFLR